MKSECWWGECKQGVATASGITRSWGAATAKAVITISPFFFEKNCAADERKRGERKREEFL